MFKLNQVVISAVAIALSVSVTALDSISAQAAIISSQVTGTWQYDSDGSGGFNVGDTFTADYTYDSTSIVTQDFSDPIYWSRYLISRVPLLSLVLNSGTVSHTFDFSTAGSNYLQWSDLQAQPTNGQYGSKQTLLYAQDYAAPEFNVFYAYSTLGQYDDGSPLADFFAQASSYNSNTGLYPTRGLSYDRVTFSTPSPTAIPTPALLPGLIGFGVSVFRRRKQVTAAD